MPKKNFISKLIQVVNLIDELRAVCPKTIPNLSLNGSEVSMSPFCSGYPQQTLNGVLIRMLLFCWLLAEITSVRKKLEKSLLDSDQTSVHSNRPLIKLVSLWACLCSDHPKPKWPLIRQDPDPCPDKKGARSFSRSCISSA